MWRVSFPFNHFKGNYLLPFRMKIQTVRDKHPQTKSTHWEPSRPISHNAVGFSLPFSTMCSHARSCAQDTVGTPALQTVNASVPANLSNVPGKGSEDLEKRNKKQKIRVERDL